MQHNLANRRLSRHLFFHTALRPPPPPPFSWADSLCIAFVAASFISFFVGLAWHLFQLLFPAA